MSKRRWYMITTYRRLGWLGRRRFFSLAESPAAAMKAVQTKHRHALITCCQELFA